MSTFEPVEHNKQPNRIIYFGTDGCVGHYPLGIKFNLTRKEYKDFQEIDRIITDEILDGNTGTFIRIREKKRKKPTILTRRSLRRFVKDMFKADERKYVPETEMEEAYHQPPRTRRCRRTHGNVNNSK